MKKYNYRISKCIIGETEYDMSRFITSFLIYSDITSPYKRFILNFGIKQEYLNYFADINYGAIIKFEYEVYTKEGAEEDNVIKRFNYDLLVLSNQLPIPFGSASMEEEKVMKSYNYLSITSIPYKAYNKAANEINQIYMNTNNKKILKDIFDKSEVKYYINPSGEDGLNHIDIDQFFIPNLSLFDSFKHIQQYAPLFKKHFNIFVDDSNYVNDIMENSPKEDYLCYLNDHDELFKKNELDVIIYLTNENSDYSNIYTKILEDEHAKYYCRIFSQPMRNRLPSFMYHKRFNQTYVHYGLKNINQIFDSNMENLVKEKGIFDLSGSDSFYFDLEKINQKRNRIITNNFLIDQTNLKDNFKNRFSEEINPLNDIIIRNDYYFHPGIIPGSVVKLSMDGRKPLPSLEEAYTGKFLLKQIRMHFKVRGLSSDESICHTYLSLSRSNTTTRYVGNTNDFIQS